MLTVILAVIAMGAFAAPGLGHTWIHGQAIYTHGIHLDTAIRAGVDGRNRAGDGLDDTGCADKGKLLRRWTELLGP